jgi:hypothetical protein
MARPGSVRAALAVCAAVACAATATANTAAAPAAAAGEGEAALLGPDHAAEHARQRAIALRAPRQAPSAPVPARADVSTTPRQAGRWAPAVPLPVIAINAAMLPTGKVLMFAYPARPGYPGYENLAHAYLWDPRTGRSTQVDPPVDAATGKPTNIWCGGTSFLADGRVLVTGGNVDDPQKDFHGLDTVFTFNPFTGRWAEHERMAQGRWYPSQLLMPDGRTMILSGLTRPGDRDYDTYRLNTDVEVFSPDGRIDALDDLRFGEEWNPAPVDVYPHMFWMPRGHALVAGPQPDDSFWIDRPRRRGDTPWGELPDLSVDRYWSSAVKLEGGKIMVLGGSGPATEPPSERRARASTEIFDDGNPRRGWQPGPPLTVERSHANSVLLPDGTVATVGGGWGEVNSEYYRWEFDPDRHTRVELYDPRTGQVTVGPPQTEGRTYHSVALLLPDGRVLSAGDDINGPPTQDSPTGAGTGTASDTGEVYSPPYLFRGRRPRLTAAPRVIRRGRRFTVRTPDRIASAVLVAPAAVTHSVDMSQRLVPLRPPVKGRGRRLLLRAPSRLDAAPPGYYMLFVLNGRGVPSVARFVRLVP